MSQREHVEAPDRRAMSVRVCRNPECRARYVVPKRTRVLPGCPVCTPELPGMPARAPQGASGAVRAPQGAS